jgi:uncharacterized protein
MTGETNLTILLKNMQPVLNNGQYVFCTLTTGRLDMSKILMLFKEKEGTTIILEKKEADKLRLKYPSVCAWISLTVHSSLEAVGLTAAFANALARENISCNVVAAYYHDHIFVPFGDAEKAMAALKNVAQS